MDAAIQNVRVQKVIAITSFILFLAKIFAWYLTQSVAILTDALESIVNIIAGLIGWYSLNVSAKPRDFDHPYGHGKIEFVSAAVEGTFIIISGVFLIYTAIQNLVSPLAVSKLDVGILLIGATAIINYGLGFYSVRIGTANHSLALISSGKHLKSDAWSSAGIIGGLLLLIFTGIQWIDAVVAIFFSFFIIYTGFTIIKSSLSGIMDAADDELIVKLVATINSKRRLNWMDLHNLRVIKYGALLHIDCHLTVPWYFNVAEAHKEIDELTALVRQEYGEMVEFFVHSDGCMEFSCAICHKSDCPVRKHAFEKTITWTVHNVRNNAKHHAASE